MSSESVNKIDISDINQGNYGLVAGEIKNVYMMGGLGKKSRLTPLINSIVESYDEDIQMSSYDLDVDVDYKLDYNSVKVLHNGITDSTNYHGLVEDALSSIDREEPRARTKMLKAINTRYRELVDKILIKNKLDTRNRPELRLECIRENSDEIVSAMISDLMLHGGPDCYEEDLRDSCKLIVYYGVVNCQILEEPK